MILLPDDKDPFANALQYCTETETQNPRACPGSLGHLKGVLNLNFKLGMGSLMFWVTRVRGLKGSGFSASGEGFKNLPL